MKFILHLSLTNQLPARRYRLVIISMILILPLLACGLINPHYRLNNDVRLAVYEYEREVRGPVDDLVIDFKRDEPRLRFDGQNENGGHTIWLYNLGVREYFTLRPQQATYLYIQAIEFSDDFKTATATVYRGDGAGFAGRWLTLAKEEGKQWVVTDDVGMTDNVFRSTTETQ